MIDKVKIGPIEYTVKENARFPQDNLAGQIRYLEQVIEIQPGMGKAVTKVTLWHEMIHGILFAGGYREQDEQMVDVLAYGIVKLLQDNPELIEAEQAPEITAKDADWHGNGLRALKVAGINA